MNRFSRSIAFSISSIYHWSFLKLLLKIAMKPLSRAYSLLPERKKAFLCPERSLPMSFGVMQGLEEPSIFFELEIMESPSKTT